MTGIITFKAKGATGIERDGHFVDEGWVSAASKFNAVRRMETCHGHVFSAPHGHSHNLRYVSELAIFLRVIRMYLIINEYQLLHGIVRYEE